MEWLSLKKMAPRKSSKWPVTAFVLFLIPLLLQAEDLWVDQNPYVSRSFVKEGVVLKLLVDEPVRMEYSYENTGDHSTTIKLVPDKKITDFLPEVSVDNSRTKKSQKKIRTRGSLKFRMAVTVTSRNENTVEFTGNRTVAQEQGDQQMVVRVTGKVNLQDITRKGELRSADVADLALLVRGAPVPPDAGIQMKQTPGAEPGEPATPSASLSEEEKQRLLLEYLNRILGESTSP